MSAVIGSCSTSSAAMLDLIARSRCGMAPRLELGAGD
jgi:hypothetical protein